MALAPMVESSTQPRLNTLVQLTRVTDGAYHQHPEAKRDWRQSPYYLAGICEFLEKLDTSMPFELSFESFQSHLKELILLRVKRQLKN